MRAKVLTTTLFCLALATGLAAQQPPHDQRGGNQRHMEHRFEDAEQYARSFDDPAPHGEVARLRAIRCYRAGSMGGERRGQRDSVT